MKASNQTRIDMLRENIVSVRRKRKVTQKEIAESLGINQSAISRMERGEQPFTADVILMYCTKCNVSPNVLFGMKQSKSIDSNLKDLILTKYPNKQKVIYEFLKDLAEAE